MFASPNISKAQASRFSVSDLSAHSHINPSLLSTQPFSLIQSPQVNQSLFDFRFSNSSRHAHQHSSPGKDLCVDRFIPVRSDPVKKKLLFDMQQDPRSVIDEEGFSNRSQQNASYRIMLEEQILGLSHSMDSEECLDESLGHGKSSNRLLNFKSHREDRLPISDHIQQSCLPFDYEAKGAKPHNNTRRIPDKPCRVLEAPYLEDDYYLNLLDWSESNIVAVALRDTIYLWYGTDGVISRLSQMDSYSDIYTSVGWNSTGDLLATGISNGRIEIWDPFRMKVIRDDLEDHYGRVSCLGWNSNNILASGSMDNNIILRDMRIRGPQSTIMRLKGHKYEVCGLKWSPNNFQLATGGNDNKLFIWNIRKGVPEAKFGDHKAAVKALTWSPHQNGLLLSGGGNNDKTIKFWNTLTMKNVKSVYTASQVCNLLFSKNSNEFVSTHGFNNNHVVIWKYPELSKVSVLEGHTSRVLYLALSPDGETIVTGAGAADETLRFWTAFPPVPQCVSSKLMPNSTNLR